MSVGLVICQFWYPICPFGGSDRICGMQSPPQPEHDSASVTSQKPLLRDRGLPGIWNGASIVSPRKPRGAAGEGLRLECWSKALDRTVGLLVGLSGIDPSDLARHLDHDSFTRDF